MRRLILITGAMVVAAGLVACGSSSASSASQSDINAVAKQLRSDNSPLTDAQANCIAEKAAPKLSSKGLAMAKSSSNSDLSDLSKADQAAVFDSFSSCVTVDQLAAKLETSLESGSDKLDAKTSKCFTDKLAKSYSTSGDLVKAMQSKSESAITDMITSCMSSSGSIRDELVSSLKSGGMSQTQAECTADKVLSQVSPSDLAKLGSSSSLPSDIENEVEADATQCMGAG